MFWICTIKDVYFCGEKKNTPLYETMITCVLFSLLFSFQDSMDEACAEGISDEHYRLEGRPSALHHHHHPQRVHQLIWSLLVSFNFKWCVHVWLFLSSLLHTHSLSPLRSALPHLPPLHLLRLSSARPHGGALQSASIPPCFFSPPDVM